MCLCLLLFVFEYFLNSFLASKFGGMVVLVVVWKFNLINYEDS